MENHRPYNALAQHALKAALEASDVIMEVYGGRIEPEEKSDGSPITLADKKANAIIIKHLENTNIPVISEECEIPDHATRMSWPVYWIIDPLDGTKEFIGRNGEFTVNIALIKNCSPVIGVITAPALHTAWIGITGQEPVKMRITGSTWRHGSNKEELPGKPIRKKKSGSAPLTLAVSRSHPDQETTDLIRKLRNHYPGLTIYPRGSSLKLCELAEGRADIYPRYTPTFEWDIAAGHAILNAAGGELLDLRTRQPLRYTKENMQNPPFIAFADKEQSKQFFSHPAFN